MKFIKSCIVVIAILFIIGIACFIYATHYYKAEINKSLTTKQIVFSIASGESVSAITDDLYSQKIISNTLVFSLYLKFSNQDKNIEAGKYLIPSGSTIQTLAVLLQKGNFYVNITITEGKRIEEQANSISNQLSLIGNTTFNTTDYIKLAKDPSQFASYSFLNNVSSLEGFLYPDTYQVEKDIDAKGVIIKMLDAFNTKVYSIYNYSKDGLSFYDHIILASILVREASTDTDKKMIADILLRRYNQNFPLGVDSSIQYYLGYSNTENLWWRQNIYQTELDQNEPYNTRLHTGFPPTPICNINIGSIIDAYTPTPNSYFYFISDASGILHYAHNIEEHNANIQKYL